MKILHPQNQRPNEPTALDTFEGVLCLIIVASLIGVPLLLALVIGFAIFTGTIPLY